MLAYVGFGGFVGSVGLIDLGEVSRQSFFVFFFHAKSATYHYRISSTPPFTFTLHSQYRTS